MDSKVRSLTIIIVLSVITLAFAVVLLMNKKDEGPSKLNKQQSVTTPSISEEEGYLSFLSDDTFFDKEVSSNILTSSHDDKTQLYMLATSLSHDIRVVITDEEGNLVKGQPFYVEIDDDEYKDLDQDGIIKIPDLSAGEYYVSLKASDEYKIPDEPMRVRVKEDLEFNVIDDISYYIYTEDQINAKEEDTYDGIENDDIDDSEESGLRASEGGVLGIDVSKWQKTIDWKKVKASGIDFAIIRCGYRGSSTGVLVEDPYFKENLKGAKEAGIKVGIYFFTQATSSIEGVEEASMAVKLLEGEDIDLPIYIDSESAGGKGRADSLSKEARTAAVKAFCETIESSGYKSGIYASRSWFNNNLDMSSLDKYSIWDAEYRKTPIYKGKYDVWQYTSNGMIDGITTRVDLNIRYN